MFALTGIRYGAEIAAAAAAHKVDPKLLAAVAAQETGGPGSNSGNNIVGDGGHGHGLFQIDDRTWAFASSPAAMDPAANASQAASILADNLARYGGNVRAALSAYNAGSPTATGTPTTWPDGATLGYADSVLRHYAALGSDAQGQLVADNRETQADVGSLASLGAAFASGLTGAAAPAAAQATGSAAPTGSTAALSSLLSTLQAASPAQTQAPAEHDSSGAQAAASIGAKADDAMAGLVDGDDVLNAGSSDDGA